MNKLLKNFSLNTINQIIILVIPLITTPYLTRNLGTESLGIGTYILSIAILFYSIGTLGTNLYSRREIAYAVAKKRNLKTVYYELFIVRLILTLLTICVYILFSWQKEYSIIYFIFSLTIVGNMMDVSWFFIGMEEMKQLVIRNCLIRIASALSVFLLVKCPEDIYIYAIIKGTGDMIAFLIMLPQVQKVIKDYKMERIRIKRHFIPIIKFFLPQAASIIYVQCDKIMIGNLTSNMSSVTIYEKGEALIKLPVTFVNALSAVTLPRIANMYAKENSENMYSLMKKISNLTVFFIVPIVVGMGIVSRIFVPLYLGNDYSESSVAMIWLMPAVIAISLSSITCIQFLMPLNETSILTKSYSFAAIVNIILNFILIQEWGIIGAAVATDVAELSVFVVQYMYIHKKYRSFGFSQNLLKRFIAVALMTLICIIIEHHFGRSVMCGIIQIVLGSTLYIFIVWALKDTVIIDIMNRIGSFRFKPQNKN